MREIKFRAWDGNRMTTDFVIAPNGDYRETIPKDLTLDEGFTTRLIDPVVMQYTGLKDKNGREIYEGDIVTPFAYRKADMCKVPIAFDKGGFVLDLAPPYVTKKTPLHGALARAKQAGNEYIVIGNIYENPELLEGP